MRSSVTETVTEAAEVLVCCGEPLVDAGLGSLVSNDVIAAVIWDDDAVDAAARTPEHGVAMAEV